MLYRYLTSTSRIEQVCSLILEQSPPRMALDVESSSNTEYPELISLALPYPVEPLKNYHQIELDSSDKNIIVYLLHISRVRFRLPNLYSLLTSPSIVKIGCGLAGDQQAIQSALGCKVNPSIDLQTLELSLGSRVLSLDRLAQKYLSDNKMSFSHQNADWSGQLTEKQLLYAVKDAYLTLAIYQRMMNLSSQPPSVKEVDSTEEASLLKFLAHCTMFLGKNALCYTKVVNAIVNSYAPWRDLHPSESRPLAEKHLNLLISKGVFVSINQCIEWSAEIISQYQPPKAESNPQLKALFDHLKRVHHSPMKRVSLIGALANTFWTTTPVYGRKTRTEQAITQMIKEGYLREERNYLFW